MSKLNAGEVLVTLNGEDCTLKPTLQAIRSISRQFDGIGNATKAVLSQNFDGCVTILKAGLHLSDRDAKNFDEKVYANGLTADLLIPLIKYLAILGNGGRPLPDEPVDAEPAAGNGQA